MMMRISKAARRASLLLLCVVEFANLAACASGGAYENFAKWMQEQVGKSTTDPSAFRNRYPELRVAVRSSGNGKVEEEYRTGQRCWVFFEIDKVSETIVAWRRKGSKEDCALNR